MEDYPKTLLEFEKRFANEEACQQYLFDLRWPDGFRCFRCGHYEAWSTSRGVYRCRHCDFQTSVIAGTIFQDTVKPLRLWFWAMWYVASQKNGVSALGLQRVLGLGSYRTAWTWLHKLRCAMVRPGRDRLSGVVEVDETYIGGEKPGKRGRGAAEKSLVGIAVEDKGDEGIGRIRLGVLTDASRDSLTTFVKDRIVDGSTIRTDDWVGYNSLEAAGYRHFSITKNDLKLAHLVASLLKRWLLGTHQGAVSHEHLAYYLDEYTFRFNRRTSRYRGKLFYRLIQQAVAIEPIQYSALVKHARGPKPKNHHI